jgi:hypothetical protein
MDGERDGQSRMDEAAALIVDGVARLAGSWVERTVAMLLDAWGGLDDEGYARAIAAARTAGETASARVVRELQEFFAQDAATQRTTPLVIVRSLRVEPTQVLQTAGVPEVVRDPYEVRAFPDDIYGIVPRDVATLGDDDLGVALLAWGMGKAAVLGARSRGDDGS